MAASAKPMKRSLADRIADIDEWEPSVERVAAEIMALCREIVELPNQPDEHARARRLEEEHEELSLVSRLRMFAKYKWWKLAPDVKWKKRNVLAALQSGCEKPCPFVPAAAQSSTNGAATKRGNQPKSAVLHDPNNSSRTSSVMTKTLTELPINR